MADGQDQSQGGGFLGGLGKALNYAIPAAAGAALGGPMGALAGLGMGSGMSEQQMRRQEIAMEWKRLNLQSQQTAIALHDATAREDIINGLPKDEQALARADFAGWAQHKLDTETWNHTISTLNGDPEFAQSLGLGDPKMVEAIAQFGPKNGPQVLDKIVEARNKIMGNAKVGIGNDGNMVLVSARPDGSVTTVPVPGVKVPTYVLGEEKVGLEGKGLDIRAGAAGEKARTDLTKQFNDVRKAVLAEAGPGTKLKRAMSGTDAAAVDAETRKRLRDSYGWTDDDFARMAGTPPTPRSAGARPSSVTVSPPSGYRPTGRKVNGKDLYENPMAPKNKRYWTP